MNSIIDELKSLIVNPKKGTTGYTCLKNSERVTAHKLNVIINKLTNDMTQSERLEYILKLEQERHEEDLKYRLTKAKQENKQKQIAFMTSFMAAQATNLLLASIGLCKRNDK